MPLALMHIISTLSSALNAGRHVPLGNIWSRQCDGQRGQHSPHGTFLLVYLTLPQIESFSSLHAGEKSISEIQKAGEIF